MEDLYALQNGCRMELQNFLDAFNNKIHAFRCFYAKYKTSRIFFRSNIQETIFFESPRDFLVVLKNCSFKHTKNRDGLNVHTFQVFPTRRRAELRFLFQQ